MIYPTECCFPGLGQKVSCRVWLGSHIQDPTTNDRNGHSTFSSSSLYSVSFTPTARGTSFPHSTPYCLAAILRRTCLLGNFEILNTPPLSNSLLWKNTLNTIIMIQGFSREPSHSGPFQTYHSCPVLLSLSCISPRATCLALNFVNQLYSFVRPAAKDPRLDLMENLLNATQAQRYKHPKGLKISHSAGSLQISE